MTISAPTPYEINNMNKTNEVSKIVNTINDDPISKINSYDTIQIETERLLKREQTLFMINTVVTIGLLITLFKVL